MPRMKTRRDLLKLTLGSSLAAAAVHAAPSPASRVIDTHTHFYDPTRPQGVPWPKEGSPLYRPVYPKDWLAQAGRFGVRETVVVEASPLIEDNDWILNLAEKERSIVGFVGNVLPTSADFTTQIKRLAANPLFRGIRVNGALVADNVGSTDFIAAMKLLADKNLALDVNGLKDFNAVATLAEKVSELRIVINHCGNCGDAQKITATWKDGITACARRDNISCKVSALMEMTDTPPGKAPTDTSYYQPVLDHLWDRFGQERLMYASDWPVSDKGSGYDVIIKVASEFAASKGADFAEKFFWKNSLAIYQWTERK
jgi:predicted TIM-barrel fold metal-dependent hydrolase